MKVTVIKVQVRTTDLSKQTVDKVPYRSLVVPYNGKPWFWTKFTVKRPLYSKLSAIIP